MKCRIHAVEQASRANGPGLRAVVWFQGCTLGCPGCFNPETHSPAKGRELPVASLARELLAGAKEIEGVTVSGGEPFQQPAALQLLLRSLSGSGLSTLVFSGYTLKEIQDQPYGCDILSQVDALVAGRYVRTRHHGKGLLGSLNQQIHLLTSRYTHADFNDIPKAEIILHRDGSVTLSGVAPPDLPGAICEPSTAW